MSSRRRLLGPRWGRDSEGLKKEGTDCEAGPSATQDFIFSRIFFFSEISSHLTSCGDAPGPRAHRPGSGLWEGELGPPSLDLGAESFGTFCTQLRPSPFHCWVASVPADPGCSSVPPQPGSHRTAPCMFIEGCLLSGRKGGKSSIFMLGLFHV